MRLLSQIAPLLLFIIIGVSCTLQEDPGPLQYDQQPYAITDFNRLDIGDAMQVTVVRGTLFSVEARGDRRNLNDLEITKVGNTLTARFNNNRNRRHTTYITITMPILQSANFYGAVNASMSGFESETFSLNLSGASYAQIDVNTNDATFNLSGASNLTISGNATSTVADLSGASLLKAYNLETDNFKVLASGASHGYVKANKTLVAEASGASSILYRGEPVVTSKVTGSSTIMKD